MRESLGSVPWLSRGCLEKKRKDLLHNFIGDLLPKIGNSGSVPCHKTIIHTTTFGRDALR